MKKFLAATILAASIASPAMAYDKPTISVGLGSAGVFDNGVFAGNIEWRGSSFQSVPGVSPIIGLEGDTDGAAYAYGGVNYDLSLTDRLSLVPSFAIGAYHAGDSKKLGGAFEFREAIEANYKITPETRVGIQLNHKSNAGIYSRNPGTEELLGTLSFQY